MTESAPVDLMDLVDSEGNRCTVRVTGRFQPGVLTGHDILCADVLVSTKAVEARLELHLFQEDLDAWEQDLSRLGPGRTACLGGDRGPSLDLNVNEEDRLSVRVDDPDSLTASLSTRPHADWVAEHRRRLEQVRRTWPSEVVESPPNVYQWRNRARVA